MTNEKILARATELVVWADKADPSTKHEPQQLSITSEMIRTTHNGYMPRWLAHFGNFTTYPNRYESVEAALDGLLAKIQGGLPRGGSEA